LLHYGNRNRKFYIEPTPLTPFFFFSGKQGGEPIILLGYQTEREKHATSGIHRLLCFSLTSAEAIEAEGHDEQRRGHRCLSFAHGVA
jgi:hypothetical protein